jgi:hypothetical protein
MENSKLKKAQRNSNNSDSTSVNNTPFSTPKVSPILSSSESSQLDDVPLTELNIADNKKKVQINLCNNKNNVEFLNERTEEEEEEDTKDKDTKDKDTKNKDTKNKDTKEPLLETLILNLKIISKLKPGYKLSLKEEDSLNVYIDNSYFQYFYRIFSDNSRETTITFLENLDSNISKKIENLLNMENSDMFLNSKENILLNFSHELNLSLIGLNNLINTYSGDEYTISRIEMIINNFELKIRKITNILKVD